MTTRRTFTRREFLGTAAAASTLSVLPRHVLGGPGFVAPSDRITFALIGSGTMGISMLIDPWLPRDEIQVTSVCDPNRQSTNYRDWSRNGALYRIRQFLDEPEWGDPAAGIPGGREVGKYVVDTYYAKNRPGSANPGCRTYADYRELLARESDLDGLLVMTPEHLHGTIAMAGMNAGKHVIMHKTLANTAEEVRKVADKARQTNVVTHLLAWYDEFPMYQLRDWIQAGAIGTVREIHNWSNRPVWPQGWADWLEEQPVPEGFDWDLWLGPVPHRPYNINYTHALFRGWYDFGSGCLGDMGNYSLWRVYRILGLGAPDLIEATPATDAQVVDSVSRPFRSRVAFPKSSTIRFRHPAKGDRAAVDVFWYDGGIRPRTPEELFEDDEELALEGMLIVGDEGKILAGFMGDNPRLIPERRHKAFEGSITTDPGALPSPEDEWIGAIREGTKSRGSFEEIEPLAEATCLGTVALRTGRRLHWDSAAMKVTNVPDANKLLRREYREGWGM